MTTISQSRSSTTQPKATGEAQEPVSAPVMNLLDFDDDEPAAGSGSVATAPVATEKVLPALAPLGSAGGEYDFADFQPAPSSPPASASLSTKPPAAAPVAGNSWCELFKTWQKAYTFDPLASLTSVQAMYVLGGQQLLWTEQSGPQNLDSIVWPRAAASAEVFWTGASRGDVRSALPRLHELGYRMRQRGVGAISLQLEWRALRSFTCDLNA